jgi:hypothetical protein
MKNLLIPFTIIITTIILITSCKKDRIEPEEEPLNDYDSVNDYLDTKKQQEQEFIIDGTNSDTITGVYNGTRIFNLDSNCLRDNNNNPITLPFKLHLVELYTPKEMIYWQMPTVASGNILETDGEIRIRATKNGQELSINCPYTFEIKNNSPNTSMNLFTGSDNGSFVNWTISSNPLTTNSYGYSASPSSFGWFNADIQVGSGSGNTLSFTSQTDILTNVGIFIYIPSSQTVMQVYNETSGLIPNGSSVKIIMMAIDGNGQLFSYTESRTVNNSATIDISLTQTTDAALTSYLDAL